VNRESHKTLTEKNIAWAIGIAKSKRETDAVIARRLGRGIGPVREALSRFLARGIMRRIDDGEMVLFEVVPRAERPTPPPDGEGADFEDELEGSDETVRAEALWKKRLGTRRWHDDPRAVAEKLRTEFYQSPLPDRTLGGVVEYG